MKEYPSPENLKMSTETIERMPPEPGGTVIIMQRHGSYDRETGHLTAAGKGESLERSRAVLGGILEQIPENERQLVDLFVVASPTELHGGQRSMETATAVLESANALFEANGIPTENILQQSPRATAAIEQPRMFDDGSGFRDFLAEKYSDASLEFWKAFEEERHQAEREEFGSEGPLEMSDRFAHFTNVLARFARRYHHSHQNQPRRLIIWSISHYDTITTYYKNHIAKIDQKEHVPVDYDGGMSVYINPQGEASVTLSGHQYPVELATRGVTLPRQQEEDIAGGK